MGGPKHYPGQWADVYGTIDVASGLAGLTQEALRDVGVSISWFRHDQADAFLVRYQNAHGWRRGTQVRPHLHLLAAGDASGTVAFDYWWTWTGAGTGLAMPAISSWSTAVATLAVTAAEQWQEVILGAAPITPPASVHASSHLWVKWARKPGTDTYEGSKTGGPTVQANLGYIWTDCHQLIESNGSDLEYPSA